MSDIDAIYLKAVEYEAGCLRQKIDGALERCRQEISCAIGSTELGVDVNRFEHAVRAAATKIVQHRASKLLHGF